MSDLHTEKKYNLCPTGKQRCRESKPIFQFHSNLLSESLQINRLSIELRYRMLSLVCYIQDSGAGLVKVAPVYSCIKLGDLQVGKKDGLGYPERCRNHFGIILVSLVCSVWRFSRLWFCCIGFKSNDPGGVVFCLIWIWWWFIVPKKSNYTGLWFVPH